MKNKHVYKAELRKALRRIHADEMLIKEIYSHVEVSYHSLKENGYSEREIYEKLKEQIGSPAEIAKAYKDHTAPAENHFSTFFILLNLLFFIGGTAVTVLYLFADIAFIAVLTPAKWLILSGYLFFWLLLGYLGGREYGINGKTVITKTVFASMLPNIIFMLVVLWNLIPGKPYESMLTPDFFLACIVSTFMFPLVSKCGFLIGKKSLFSY